MALPALAAEESGNLSILSQALLKGAQYAAYLLFSAHDPLLQYDVRFFASCAEKHWDSMTLSERLFHLDSIHDLSDTIAGSHARRARGLFILRLETPEERRMFMSLSCELQEIWRRLLDEERPRAPFKEHIHWEQHEWEAFLTLDRTLRVAKVRGWESQMVGIQTAQDDHRRRILPPPPAYSKRDHEQDHDVLRGRPSWRGQDLKSPIRRAQSLGSLGQRSRSWSCTPIRIECKNDSELASSTQTPKAESASRSANGQSATDNAKTFALIGFNVFLQGDRRSVFPLRGFPFWGTQNQPADTASHYTGAPPPGSYARRGMAFLLNKLCRLLLSKTLWVALFALYCLDGTTLGRWLYRRTARRLQTQFLYASDTIGFHVGYFYRHIIHLVQGFGDGGTGYAWQRPGHAPPGSGLAETRLAESPLASLVSLSGLGTWVSEISNTLDSLVLTSRSHLDHSQKNKIAESLRVLAGQLNDFADTSVVVEQGMTTFASVETAVTRLVVELLPSARALATLHDACVAAAWATVGISLDFRKGTFGIFPPGKESIEELNNLYSDKVTWPQAVRIVWAMGPRMAWTCHDQGLLWTRPRLQPRNCPSDSEKNNADSVFQAQQAWFDEMVPQLTYKLPYRSLASDRQNIMAMQLRNGLDNVVKTSKRLMHSLGNAADEGQKLRQTVRDIVDACHIVPEERDDLEGARANRQLLRGRPDSDTVLSAKAEKRWTVWQERLFFWRVISHVSVNPETLALLNLLQKEILERVPQAVNVVLLGVDDHNTWIDRQKNQLRRDRGLANLNMMVELIQKELGKGALRPAVDVSEAWAEGVREKEMESV